MVNWYDRHAAECDVWQVAIDDLHRCTCRKNRHLGAAIPEDILLPSNHITPDTIELIEDGLDRGLTTSEIASDVGKTYKDIMRILRYHKLDSLVFQYGTLRKIENERHKVAG